MEPATQDYVTSATGTATFILHLCLSLCSGFRLLLCGGCCLIRVSCYLASVVQVLFHLPSFHQRYWVDGQRHIAECRNGRPADCYVCQLCKVADGIYSGRYAVVPSEEELLEARREREAREAEQERARQGVSMDVDQPLGQTAVKRRRQVCTAAAVSSVRSERSCSSTSH